jgi:hypothetical protein
MVSAEKMIHFIAVSNVVPGCFVAAYASVDRG